MRERQPVGQLPRGFVGGLPVKRHHGGRHTGGTKELCAPAVADGRDLYQIRAPADGFFEAMCRCSHSVIRCDWMVTREA
jgi:hypothetical protein